MHNTENLLHQMINVEIRNMPFFLIGIAIALLGIFIITFDYPQIQYLENIRSSDVLDSEQDSLLQRLQIEFSIGIAILLMGFGLCIFSYVKK